MWIPNLGALGRVVQFEAENQLFQIAFNLITHSIAILSWCTAPLKTKLSISKELPWFAPRSLLLTPGSRGATPRGLLRSDAMSAQDYGGGDDSAEPRQNTSRTRARRGKNSVNPEPQHGISQRPPPMRREHERLVPVEPESHTTIQGHGIHPSGVSHTFPPPVSEIEGSSIPEEYQWAPQHARTHSAYMPPAYHRPTSSFHQPHLLAHHARDQSASDFYFLQSPQVSPSLTQGPFDPLGLHGTSTLGPDSTPPMLMDLHSSTRRGMHTRGGSVSKHSRTRSHRRSRTLTSSQSGQLPLPPGFPGPLVPYHHGLGIPGGIQPGPASSAQSALARPPAPVPGPSANAGADPVLGLGITSAVSSTTEGHALDQPSQAPFPSDPTHPSGFRASFPGFSEERGSPRPPVWSDPMRTSHLSTSSESLDKKTKSSRRHKRRKTRDSLPIHQQNPAQQSQSSVLESVNPMSDLNYSSQGLQYHGLGIGIGRPPPPSASAPPPPPALGPGQLTPTSASPNIGTFGPFGGNAPRHLGNEQPIPAPALLAQFEHMGVPNVPLELTPPLHGMPFLPPYVSYEQQLQQQRQLQQQLEHRHQHQPPLPQPQIHREQHQHQQSLWREEEIWPQDYWSAQRHERPPVPGPSSTPRHHSEYYRPMEPQPMHPGWPGPPFSSPSLSRSQNVGRVSFLGPPEPPMSSTGIPGQKPSTAPESLSGAESEHGELDEQLLDVPSQNYDTSAEMDWTAEDVEEMMKLLEPAEKYKWRYLSDLLTETRKKRIPPRTCQNKFHALFGEIESSSKLRSSLFYVAYRSGWDSIRESSTVREREKEPPQQQQSEVQEGNDPTGQEGESQGSGPENEPEETPAKKSGGTQR